MQKNERNLMVGKVDPKINKLHFLINHKQNATMNFSKIECRKKWKIINAVLLV